MLFETLQMFCLLANPTEHPHLLLNFDVNGTLILKDTSNGRDEEQMLASVLADNIFAEWDYENGVMSFKDYVYTVLLPGERGDQVLKAKRHHQVDHFFDWLKEHQHPIQEEVFTIRNRIRTKFTDMESGKVQYTVFPAFYALLDKLRELNIPFVIILRTFGKDLKEVADEIERNPSGVKFTKWCKFEKGQFTLEGEGTIKKTERIFEAFLQSQEHFAIQEDWKYWNGDGERARSGKKFIYDSNGNWHNVRNLSLFFDDSFTGEENDILTPVDINGASMTGKDLENKMLFRVNALEALLDDDYFIKLVEKSMK